MLFTLKESAGTQVDDIKAMHYIFIPTDLVSKVKKKTLQSIFWHLKFNYNLLLIFLSVLISYLKINSC